MKYKNIVRILLVTVALLLIPLVAMQFTDEVKWTLFDFVFMGVLLSGAGLAYEFVSSRSSSVMYRIAVGVAILASLALVWVNGAVGIIGNEAGDINMLYAVVLLVGVCGAIVARFTPGGMARTLFAMACAQFSVPLIALVLFNPGVNSWGQPGVLGIFVLNMCFVGLFVVSALLFRHAAV